MFLAFSPEQLCSDLSRQMKSLLSLNWQVLKVLSVKFQSSTLDHCHHLLIKFSCKSASKPLNAQYYTWARSHRGRHYDFACYAVCTRFWCTSTQHIQLKPSSDFSLRHWLPKQVFHKTFAHIRSGSRCHLVLSNEFTYVPDNRKRQSLSTRLMNVWIFDNP